MSITVSLTDGVTTIPLIYNQANQFAFKAMYGATLDPGEPQPVWHSPDGFPPDLVDLYDPNRQAILGFHLKSTVSANPMDNVNNALATLRRWVDGANQQAARFWVTGDVNRIDLVIQRDNSTVATYHPVVYGTVDDGQGHYSAVAHLNNMVYDAVIRLTLRPYGESESNIELYNVLPGGSIDLESGLSGQASGWNNVATSTNTLSTSIYLVNGMSQKCDASTNGGTRSGQFSHASATTGAGFVWVYVVSGSAEVSLYDDTATASRDSAVIDATDSNGVSDKFTYDIGGNKWWRVPLSSSGLTATNNHRIRVLASGAAAVFHIDAAYFRFGITDPPDAWCSYSSIDNRGDRTATNPDYQNWIDVWGIPGDVDALVRHEVTGTSITGTSGETFVLTAFKDKADKIASAFPHWIEGEDFTGTTETGSGSWADTVVAGTSAGSVARFTSGAASDSATAYNTFAYTPYPLRVYVRAKASVGTISMFLAEDPTTPPSPILENITVTLDTDYQMYYIGRVQYQKPLASNDTTGRFAVGISGFSAGAQTADIDCVWLVPVIDGNMYFDITTSSSPMSSDSLKIDGINDDAWTSRRVGWTGVFPSATSGNDVTRFYYGRLEAQTAKTHYLDDALDVTLTIVPRSKHLLGTI